MNKKIITLVSAAALAVAVPAASANASILIDIYGGVTAGMGASSIGGNTHSSQNFGVVFGMDVPLFRIEAEYNFLTLNAFNAHVGMINAYVKAPIPIITPYIGGGMGTVFGGSDDVRSGPAFQGMIGLQMDAQFLPILFDVEARVMRINEIVPGHGMTDFAIRTKLRYRF